MCYFVAGESSGDYALQQSVLSQQGTGQILCCFTHEFHVKIGISLTSSKVNNYVKTVLLPSTAFTESKFYLYRFLNKKGNVPHYTISFEHVLLLQKCIRFRFL